MANRPVAYRWKCSRLQPHPKAAVEGATLQRRNALRKARFSGQRARPPFLRGEQSWLWTTILGIAVWTATAACASQPGNLPNAPAEDDADLGGFSGGRSSGVTLAPSIDADASISGFIPELTSLVAVDGSVADAFTSCVETSQEAKRVPLDLYFMVDTSGSMSDLVAEKSSKWVDVSGAIRTFVSDPASAGLGVGLQYFPVASAGLPASCSSSTQCGAWGPCVQTMCDDGDGTACSSDEDCFGARCSLRGGCRNDVNFECSELGADCGTDTNGFNLGVCVGIAASCASGDSCDARDYEAPAVGIATLPSASTAILASLATHSPEGGTPTAAALAGAIEGARAYAAANPDHAVVAVLATDGIPNEVGATGSAQCLTPSPSSSAESQVVAVAASGQLATPTVKIFAIGVFTPDDVTSGTATLEAIARAGGTSEPFIIRTDGAGDTVEAQFIAALNAIRGASFPCQFLLPTSPSGSSEALNFGEVNVRVTTNGAHVETVPYVESLGGCDPAAGGWYYDRDPSEGGAVPTTIQACPTTCTALQNDSAARVDIALGCVSTLRVP